MMRQLPRSIAGRLVMLYSVTSGAILLLSGIFMYGAMSLHLTREKTQFLADEIRTLETVQDQHPESLEMLREEIDVESDTSHASAYHARVLEAGRLLIETPGMAEVVPPSAFPPPSPRGDHSGTAAARSIGGHHYLVMSGSTSLRGHPGVTRTFQLAVDTTHDEALRAQYLRMLSLVVVLGTWLSAGAGWFIARRGLGPLRHLAQRAQQITVSQLHERVGDAAIWPSELEALTGAFDEMLARLERSFLGLSRFSADLAHELRTPVNNLMGETEVALARPRSTPDYRRVLESSLEELERMAKLIDSLLFIARAEDVRSAAQTEMLDARAALDAIASFFEAMADEREVSISIDAAGLLLADPLLFQRAVSNVLANALNHTPAGGHVTIRLDNREGEAVVSVSDDGAGIAEEHLPKIFDRFYRVDSSRPRAHGTGLGLSLVQSIMTLHRGSVAVESQLGHGTTVSLRFPARRAT
ncbi:MAG TPA: heavy metal sensor histidine kinase [Polyangiaceae bacterium]|nr:heavy metal sensor histidine kinase [Polyangiaceae bacterium]